MFNKIDTINKISSLTNLSELQVFLGMRWYCHQFIKNFAQLSDPLELLRAVPIKWGPVQQDAFEDLKAILKEAPILTYPNFKKEFIVYTEAGKLSVGAILAQLEENS